MQTRILSLALVLLGTSISQAQMPSHRFSPINYFGRYHGFGYSDGYHACKTGKCTTVSWNPLKSMSTFYGEPTAPPPGPVGIMMQSHVHATHPVQPIYQQPQSTLMNETLYNMPYGPSGVAGDSSANVAAPNSSSIQISPPAATPNPASPYPASPYPASPYPTSPSDQNNGLLPSPGNDSLLLPSPSYEGVQAVPNSNTQTRRTPPGTRSVLAPSSFRAPR